MQNLEFRFQIDFKFQKFKSSSWIKQNPETCQNPDFKLYKNFP